MGTLSDATGDSSLAFEIQRKKRITHFNENQSMGWLCLKNDMLCRRVLTAEAKLKYF